MTADDPKGHRDRMRGTKPCKLQRSRYIGPQGIHGPAFPDATRRIVLDFDSAVYGHNQEPRTQIGLGCNDRVTYALERKMVGPPLKRSVVLRIV